MATAITVLVCLLAGAVSAPRASAAIPTVFGGDVACKVMPDRTRFCGYQGPRTTTPTFDGVPLDVSVGFPPAPASGPDGGYPLVMGFEGHNTKKLGYNWMRLLTKYGYAALSVTMRGFHQSCGTKPARDAARGACNGGYTRLMDTRYEVRDVQYLAGRLVDEGRVAPRKIAAAGRSYGGALTLALAALRDRVMLPSGAPAPWRSPAGTQLELAVGIASYPWSDFSSIWLDNGSVLDYLADARYRGRPGVERSGLINGLVGACAGRIYCAPAGADPDADLIRWRNRTAEGEPYDGDPLITDMLAELSAHHSAYGVDHSRPPAPLLIGAGFTDDVVPVSETLRFYQRTMTRFPGSRLSLYLADIGHPRAQNPGGSAQMNKQTGEWIAHYLRGFGHEPFRGVTAVTQTCPGSRPAQTFQASGWSTLARGEVRFASSSPFAVTPTAGNWYTAQTLKPVSRRPACVKVSGADAPGTASYRLPPAPAGGYTLLGSPTVIANVATPSPNSQVAARLLDVAPNGSANLVARAVWRPQLSPTAVRQVFQLNANGWHFATGHRPKLELLQREGTFWRPPTDAGTVTVSNLELRLPVAETPGSAAGVLAPAPKVLPPGTSLAR